MNPTCYHVPVYSLSDGFGTCTCRPANLLMSIFKKPVDIIQLIHQMKGEKGKFVFFCPISSSGRDVTAA